jgi:hypothetical protein
MAQVVKIRRLANPRRRNAGRRVGRRKMTAKQIKHFGTRRQKAALKAARARKRRKPAAHRRRTNPVTRIVRKTVHVYRNKRKAAKRRNVAHRRRRTSNPAPVVLTLGAVNPQHKRRSMAQRKRRRTSAKRRNPSRRRRTRIVVSAPHRRRNSTYSRRRRVGRRNPRRHSRRRNPSLFGSPVGSVSTVKMVVGGLVGVAAAKFIPTMLPSSIVSGTITRVIATGASAFVASFVARKVGLSEQIAGAVLFGGLMQTASVAMNALLPASIATRLALSGLGDLVPGQFVVPQNPLRLPPAAIPTTARTTISGLDRAYGRAI